MEKRHGCTLNGQMAAARGILCHLASKIDYDRRTGPIRPYSDAEISGTKETDGGNYTLVNPGTNGIIASSTAGQFL
jgi:hypothetical protein